MKRSSRRGTRASSASSACSCPTGRSSRSATSRCPRRPARPSTRTQRRRPASPRASSPAAGRSARTPGLEVDGLGGCPGSARPATRARRRATRRTSRSSSTALGRDRAATDRGARYVSELVVLDAGRPGAPRHGDARRQIADEPRGLRRLRLRPRVRPDGREPHRRRAGGRVEARRTAIAPPRRAALAAG